MNHCVKINMSLSTEHAAPLVSFRYPLDNMMKWFLKSNSRVKLRLTLTIGSHDTHWHVLPFQALLDDDAHCSLLLYASTKEFPAIIRKSKHWLNWWGCYVQLLWELGKLEVEWSDDDDSRGKTNFYMHTAAINDFQNFSVTLWQNICIKEWCSYSVHLFHYIHCTDKICRIFTNGIQYLNKR